jgi:flagellar biosynthesis protein FlhB
MAEESQDDKTEEPTARRLEKAKEDGQVLRSQDMTDCSRYRFGNRQPLSWWFLDGSAFRRYLR